MSIYWIEKSQVNSSHALCEALLLAPEGAVGIARSDVIAQFNAIDIEELLTATDVVHAGLCFGADNCFESIQVCSFNWHFLNPSTERPAVSWKATRDFIVFRKELLSAVGPLDDEFLDPDAALMDWVYRALLMGAKTLNHPLPGFAPSGQKIAFTGADEMLFVCKHFNRKAQNYYRFCKFWMTGRWYALRHVKNKPLEKYRSSFPFKLVNVQPGLKIQSYGALIPTIDRYDYIGKSIESLLALPFPPSEIVVVDQTPIARRMPELYEPYIKSGILKLLFLDAPGQSTARNIGLREVRSSWVLLFEDDAEAWPSMVEEHIQLIRKSGCDVSTGVIVPPGADENFLPVFNRHYFLSDILTTGNAFLRVETIFSVGGFDIAFDKGPGADDDFGKRLYQAGKTIVYNYRSIETHYKAPMGGMRVHGVWWRNRSTLLGAYPPATQTYAILKYYKKEYFWHLLLTMVLNARKRYSIFGYLVFMALLPLKLWRSINSAKHLLMSTSNP